MNTTTGILQDPELRAMLSKVTPFQAEASESWGVTHMYSDPDYLRRTLLTKVTQDFVRHVNEKAYWHREDGHFGPKMSLTAFCLTRDELYRVAVEAYELGMKRAIQAGVSASLAAEAAR